jgi:hypothetical protein
MTSKCQGKTEDAHFGEFFAYLLDVQSTAQRYYAPSHDRSPYVWASRLDALRVEIILTVMAIEKEGYQTGLIAKCCHAFINHVFVRHDQEASGSIARSDLSFKRQLFDRLFAHHYGAESESLGTPCFSDLGHFLN